MNEIESNEEFWAHIFQKVSKNYLKKESNFGTLYFILDIKGCVRLN